MAPQLRDRPTSASIVIGVTKMAWMYGKSRDWAERLFKQWEESFLAGTGPCRVFRQGKRGSLFTTLPIIHQLMPPGRDLVLYGRMSAVEAEVALAHQRLDREIVERKQADAELQRQLQNAQRKSA